MYPGSEIYGGLANTWDYGNLGVELKNNVKSMVAEVRAGVSVQCRCGLCDPDESQTWVASGHLGGFSVIR